MIRLLAIALFSTGCVIKVISPAPIPQEEYQNIYVEPTPPQEPIVIKQIIIKKENKRVIIKHPRRPPKYRKPPPRLREPPKRRKPPQGQNEAKPKRDKGEKKKDKKKDKKPKLKKGQKVSSPTKPEQDTLLTQPRRK